MIEAPGLNNFSSKDVFTDLNSLQSINSLAKEDEGAALGKISKQFESMLVRMMLKSMRDANKVFSEDSIFNGKDVEFYQDMMDDQLALNLTANKGMGIADAMQRQLQERYLGSDNKPEKLSDFKDYLQSRITVPDMPVAKPRDIEKPVKADQEIEFDGSISGFVEKLYGMAKQAAKSLGVDAEVLLSQAALETGWGKKMTDSSLNLFNIKADKRWSGDSVSVPTLEYRGGVAVKERASFRAYESLQQSFDDYVDFVKGSPRYEKAVSANDNETYVTELSKAGYATDPNYSKKITDILASPLFRQAVDQVKQMASFDPGLR